MYGRSLVYTLLAFALLACAAKKPEQFTQDKPLYDYAMRLFKNGEYTDAIPFFESLKNRFPQSPYALDSELKIADAQYEKDDFSAAEISYQSFRSLHPTHSKIPYVIFRIGMSHFKRIPRGSGRDSTETERALDVFTELSSRYPNTPEAGESKPMIEKCKRKLAEHDLYVVNFYLKRDQYNAALQRLGELKNAEFKDLRSEAGYKLGYAHYKLANYAQAKAVLEEIAQDTQAGKYQSQAKNLLSKIEPSEEKKQRP